LVTIFGEGLFGERKERSGGRLGLEFADFKKKGQGKKEYEYGSDDETRLAELGFLQSCLAAGLDLADDFFAFADFFFYLGK
jgi:hypothetical protein